MGGAAFTCAVGIDAESDKIDLLLKEVEGKDIDELISEGEPVKLQGNGRGFLCQAFTRCSRSAQATECIAIARILTASHWPMLANSRRACHTTK